MNKTTEPIRDNKRLQELFAYLKGKNMRDYVMAKTQLNTALRISDIVPLRVCDFMHASGYFREDVTIKEQKTGKEKHIAINTSLKSTLKEYIKEYNLQYDNYLFISRKGHGSRHISTTQAQRILQDAAQALHLDNFNSHSLRKTWGYNAYNETHNIALIMQVYNHASAEVTLRYIGITQTDKDNLYNMIQF